MFKVICFFLSLFLLFSCTYTESKDELKLIGNCQYVIFENSYGNIGTHKGDCTNPIHKCNAVVIHDTIYVMTK